MRKSSGKMPMGKEPSVKARFPKAKPRTLRPAVAKLKAGAVKAPKAGKVKGLGMKIPKL